MAKPGKRWKFEKILKMPSRLAKRHRAKKAQAEEISEMLEKGFAHAEQRGENTKPVKRKVRTYVRKNPDVYLKAIEAAKTISNLHPEDGLKEEHELEQFDGAIAHIFKGLKVPKGHSGIQPFPNCDLQINRLKNGKIEFLVTARSSEGLETN